MKQSTNNKTLYFFASVFMTLPPAFLFYALANTPHVIVVPLLIYIVSFFKKKPIPYSDRSIIYSVLLALILAVLLNMLFPMHQERFMSIGRAFTPQITIPFLIFIAAISTFFTFSQYTIGLNATLAMFILLMAGDFQGLNSYNENSSFFSFLIDIKYYNKFFLTLATIELFAIIVSFLLTNHSDFHTKNPKVKKFKLISIPIVLVIILLLSISNYSTYIYFKSDLRKLEQYIVQLRHFSSMNISKVLFGKEVNLRRTINSDIFKNHKLIMLRVEGPKPPGYLRGRTYDSYINGKWSKSAGKIYRLKETPNIGTLALSAFFVGKKIENKNAKTKYNIFMTDACISNYIFYPPNAQRIEMVAEHLNFSPNGDFLPKSWNKDGGYTTYQYDNPPYPAYQKPKYPKSTHYLFIPKCVKKAISSISEKIDKQYNTQHKKLSDREIVNQIIMYLHEHYTYTLNLPDNKLKTDPVTFFLNTSKKGHCELFASAAALLLRYKGLPSRYTTGFICIEQHPSGDYFVSRMGNAHAWSETYLRDEKKWILVEATPPDGIVPYETKWGIFNVWIDKIKYSLSKRISEIRRGYFTRAVINFFFDIFLISFNFLFHPLRGFISLFFLLIIIYIIKLRKKNKIYTLERSAETIKLTKKMDKFIASIENKTNIKRKSSETLEEWIKRLEDSDSSQKINIEKIKDFIAWYRVIRFTNEPITSQKLKIFGINSKKTIKNFNKF